MKLVKSRVIFEPSSHTYTLDGLSLQGITGMLSRKLFKDKYDSIPQSILDEAAKRGKAIHQDCELADTLGIISDSQEVTNYIKLKALYNLVPIANEYIVSDNNYFASPIDVVFKSTKNGVSIADIKTTSSLDEEYVSWQLSIYKYLFELQNPTIKVDNLYAIWLRGDIAKLYEVEPKSTEDVIKLLDSEINNTDVSFYKKELPSEVKSAELAIFEIKSNIKKLELKELELKKGLVDLMNAHNIKSYKGEYITISKKEAFERTSIDSELLKGLYPEAYKACLKVSKVKESIDIRIKNKI